MKKIHVLIADDHKILRQSLISLLRQSEEIEIIGEAANGREAIAETQRLHPDVLILDITLPQLNGLDVLESLKGQMNHTKVIILTMHKTEEMISRAYRAGVAAYLLKENAFDELLHAIHVVASGGKYISDQIAPAIVAGLITRPGDYSDTAQPLSTREREVMQLIAEGYANKEIADILNLSLKTVETHRANIMRKMNFHSVTDLVLYAVRNNIIEP